MFRSDLPWEVVFRPKSLIPADNELEHAANWAVPENQAELVPGPDQKMRFKFYF